MGDAQRSGVSLGRVLVVGSLVAAVVVAGALWLFLDRADDRGPDADGNRPEDVALTYVEALNTDDYATMWDHGSDYEHDGRDRAGYIESWEASTTPVVPEGTDHEVTEVSFDGIWTRVGIRWAPPTGASSNIDVLVEEADGRYAVTATGPHGFDLDDTPLLTHPDGGPPRGGSAAWLAGWGCVPPQADGCAAIVSRSEAWGPVRLPGSTAAVWLASPGEAQLPARRCCRRTPGRTTVAATVCRTPGPTVRWWVASRSTGVAPCARRRPESQPDPPAPQPSSCPTARQQPPEPDVHRDRRPPAGFGAGRRVTRPGS